MSLMLRKACQDVLDENKLGNYHAVINEYNNRLDIVSECGKPFVQIAGIRFGKKTPTAAEIEYASELLTDFLATHKILLDNYAKAVITFSKLKKVEKTKGKLRADDTNGSPDTKFDFGCTFADGPFTYKIRYNKKKLITKINDVDGKATAKMLSAYKEDKTKKAEAVTHMNNYTKYILAERNVNRLLTAVSTCNI